MDDTTARLRDVPFHENYSTSGSSMLHEFYMPALAHASTYDRAAGYFSSAILALAPTVFSDFVTRGGKMRLLCSPNLSQADAEAILSLPETHRPGPLEVASSALADLAHGTNVQARAVRCMRSLIEAGVLEVRFVTVGRSGLYHEKIGIFADSFGDRVSFSGSANETAAAWSGLANFEGIEVFPEWTGSSEERRCARHADQFDETWHGLRRNLTITTSEEAARVIRAHVILEPLDQAIESLRDAVRDAEFNPDAIPLREYQKQVLASWNSAGQRGIVAFATGGGKTRTALEAVRQWINLGKPALILVPSELLHEQWAQEIASHLGNPPVLLAGAGNGHRSWSPRLSDYTRPDPSLGPRVVLATYKTAATPRFLEILRDGPHLLVVGDEVHSVGAPDTRRLLEGLDAGGRLGLSATPQRYGDESGTRAIFDYFGPILEPEFSLSDALRASVLVPYDYDFFTCKLTEEEQIGWNKFTDRVAREIARNKGEMSEHARHLLRMRARISKRAHHKSEIARRVVSQEYKTGDRWLVYCSDVEHLLTVRDHLEDLGVDLLEYHSRNDQDHEATLDYFTTRGGILLAIKCLDEGVDIPMINRALILASSTNPREYVQRRGRVLRKSPGKHSSHLYDVIVVGEDGLAITPSEVVRALEFARDSRNTGPEIYLEELAPPSIKKSFSDVEEQ